MKMKKKIIGHLKDDMKGYAKERKYLKKEMKEDADLVKTLKGKKNGGKKKKACCKACEKGKDCEGKKRAPRKRVEAKKKAGGIKRRKVQKSK